MENKNKSILNNIISFFSIVFLIIPVLLSKFLNFSFDFMRRESVFKHNSLKYTLRAFCTPSTYIIDNIYLGSCLGACNLNLLNKNKIGYIINISEDIPNFFEDKFKYLQIKKKDNGKEELEKKNFEESYNYILRSQDKNKKIFIHCFVGRSRSVSLIIYYLMKKYNYTIKESLDFIKKKRDVIDPAIKFINNLKKYEKN
jgi:hypothetical protein